MKTKIPGHNLIIFRVGKHAELLAWLFQEDSEFQVIGFCQDPVFQEYLNLQQLSAHPGRNG